MKEDNVQPPHKFMTCPDCGQDKMCWFAEDPYSAEINDDHTEVWACSECRQASAWEI